MELEKEIEDCKDLEIVDAGLELEELIGPDMICCWGAYVPLRM